MKYLIFTLAIALMIFGGMSRGRAADIIAAGQETATGTATVTITIMHTNDIHGVMRGTDAPAGMGLDPAQGVIKIATLIRSIREQSSASLLLDAGDVIQGTPMMYLMKGRPMFRAFNMMGYDAVTIGNHEFDWGPDVLRDNLEIADADILCANCEWPPRMKMDFVKPYIIREIQGVRVAIVGLLTRETLELIYDRDYRGLVITDPNRAARDTIRKIGSDADAVIVLSHLGYPGDVKLANDVKGISLIIGGHTHTPVMPPSIVNKVPIVNTGHRGAGLGVMQLEVTKNHDGKVVRTRIRKPRIEYVTQDTPDAADIAAMYAPIADAVEKHMRKHIGESIADIPSSDRTPAGETTAGSLFADLLREGVESDIALIGTSMISEKLGYGRITRANIYNMMKSYTRQEVFITRLRGSAVRVMLEDAVSENRLKYQVSGVEFSYSPKAPAGGRVREIRIDGSPLDPEKIYSVAAACYLIECTGAFELTGEKIETVRTKAMQRDIIMAAIRKRVVIVPPQKGRVTISQLP